MNSVMGTVQHVPEWQPTTRVSQPISRRQLLALGSAQAAYTYQTAGSVAQKQANDAMVKGIVQQQAQIQADAANLQRLQSQASTADGQMKALMAANQLAALQQEQLLQIRALLLPRAASPCGPERHAGK